MNEYVDQKTLENQHDSIIASFTENSIKNNFLKKCLNSILKMLSNRIEITIESITSFLIVNI